MNGLYKGALIISIGTVLTKLLGALYRVPLTSLIGAEGIGLYQMVFPFYTMLLTLSSTGIPSALAKLIAEGKNGVKLVKKAVIFFGLLGFLGSLIMFIFGEKIATIQGNSQAGLCYKMLSPSVFFVSVLSCFRGYFQGKSNMVITTVSQIIEQVIKLLVALLLVWLLPLAVYQKAGVCCLAVSISEVVATLYAFIKYKRKVDFDGFGEEVNLKRLILVVAPIFLSSILLPFARAVDSFLVLKLLPQTKIVSTGLYGIYSGGVESLVGVPVAITYGLSVSGLPLISKEKNNKKLVYKLVISTFLLGLAFALTVYIFAKPIVSLLYFNLEQGEKLTFVSLLKLSAVNVLLLSLIQSLTSVLIGQNKAKIAPINLGVGVVVKIIALFIFLPNPRFSIFGLAISDILCYFVATFLDLLYIIRYNISYRLERKREYAS